jgi:hypothetical protein
VKEASHRVVLILPFNLTKPLFASFCGEIPFFSLDSVSVLRASRDFIVSCLCGGTPSPVPEFISPDQSPWIPAKKGAHRNLQPPKPMSSCSLFRRLLGLCKNKPHLLTRRSMRKKQKEEKKGIHIRPPVANAEHHLMIRARSIYNVPHETCSTSALLFFAMRLPRGPNNTGHQGPVLWLWASGCSVARFLDGNGGIPSFKPSFFDSLEPPLPHGLSSKNIRWAA